MDLTKERIALLHHYGKNPINGIESLFDVTLDDQQKELVIGTWKQHARVAVKSCTGAGKTACLVWMSILLMLTREDCRILITAPSSNQLHRVYHSELLKWAAKMPGWARGYLDIKKESFNVVDVEYQMANLVTGSPSNLESLAGGHARNYIILVDEASGIEEKVFDVLFRTLGSSKDGKMILTSNPVRNTGRFYEIFSQEKEMWKRLTFTAHGSKMVEPKWIKDMADQYGIDSDNYQIGVLGEFGRIGETQFFPTADIEAAFKNRLHQRDYHNFPIVGGLDVARYGDDTTVFVTRQGPAVLDITEYRGLSTMEVANRAVSYIRQHNLATLNVDGIGIGAGVVDRLKELWRDGMFTCPIVDVVISNKSTQPHKYANLRSQLYGDMREWLANSAEIPDDKTLISQLSAITYTYNGKMQLQLLNKKDIKRLEGFSPDIVDAITLSFATGVYGYRPKSKKRRVKKRGNRL